VVAADQLVGDPDQALDILLDYLEEPARRGAIGTQPELARVTS
jgi:hypothetical protein